MENNFFNEEFEDARQWSELISHKSFDKLVKKINNEISTCDKNIEKAAKVASLDSSIKISIEVATKEKLKELLRYFDFMRDKKLLFDKQLATQRVINTAG